MGLLNVLLSEAKHLRRAAKRPFPGAQGDNRMALGGGAVGRGAAQAQRFPGPVGLGPQVHSGRVGAGGQYPAAGQGAVRLWLPLPAARPLAERVPGASITDP